MDTHEALSAALRRVRYHQFVFLVDPGRGRRRPSQAIRLSLLDPSGMHAAPGVGMRRTRLAQGETWGRMASPL